jgi:hypothetical protein
VRTSHLASSLYLLVLGLGIGLFLQVMVLIVQNTAAPRDLGTATSSVNFARQVGSSAGVALIGAPFIHRLDGHLAARVPASGAGHLRAAQVSSITPHGLAQVPPLRHVIGAAFAGALPPIYAYLIPLLAAASVLTLMLREIPLRNRPRPGRRTDRPAAGPRGCTAAQSPPPLRRRPASRPPPHSQNIPPAR